jgi:CRISPR-associated Csx2 family protein
MAKAFISFLGTSDYLDCRYSLDNQAGNVVKYFQEDLVDRFCCRWDSNDQIRIFTTADALEKNWKDNGHQDRKTGEVLSNPGLENRLQKRNLTASVQRYDIPDGKDEAEIWLIFQSVFDTLNPEDEIIFDITHGFRSIPMLFMALVGYARLLKKITVSGIYYGAFESLGSRFDVEKIEETQRIAPIFDLTSFGQLIKWTEATQSFVLNGSAKEFAELTRKGIGPVLRDSKGQDQVAAAIGDISRSMDMISSNLLVNRGADIIRYDYHQVATRLAMLEDKDIFIRPFAPLLAQIKTKIQGFTKNDIHNGFKAVEWCVQHGLYQQAITMLQETMVTFFLDRENRDWGVKANRDAVSDAVSITCYKERTVDEKQPETDLIHRLLNDPLMKAFAPDLEALSRLRNDVNHGGYLTEEDKRAKNSTAILDRFETILNRIMNNLSNVEKPDDADKF